MYTLPPGSGGQCTSCTHAHVLWCLLIVFVALCKAYYGSAWAGRCQEGSLIGLTLLVCACGCASSHAGQLSGCQGRVHRAPPLQRINRHTQRNVQGLARVEFGASCLTYMRPWGPSTNGNSQTHAQGMGHPTTHAQGPARVSWTRCRGRECPHIGAVRVP